MDPIGTGTKNPVWLLGRRKLHLLLIVVVGAAIYANTLKVPFYFDDYVNLIDLPLVKNLPRFLDFGSAYESFGRRYFGYLTFALNYRVNGLDVTGYHLVNIGIHLAAALLLYRLVILAFRTPSARAVSGDEAADGRAGFVALLAALLFVSHPLQTQAVTYIVQRFASLAAMLYLLSLTCYVSGRVSMTANRSLAAGGWFAAAVAAGFLALMTKETAFTLPLAMVLYELIFFPDNLKKKVAALLVTVPVLAATGAGLWAASSGKPVSEFFGFLDRATRLQTEMPRLDYLATQFRVIVTYLRLTVAPFGQRIDWDYPVYGSLLAPPVVISAAFLLAIFAAGVWALRLSRRESADPARSSLYRLAAFGIFWFFLAHTIESGIFPIVDVIFEHRMYLPSAGLFVAVAAAVSLAGGAGTLVPGWPDGRILVAAAAVVIFLAGMTVARNKLWRNEIALWEDNSWKCPKKGRVFLNLGLVSERKGDYVSAEEAYHRASELSPGDPYPPLYLGRMYQHLGRLDDALAAFRLIPAGDANARLDLGRMYLQSGRLDEALAEFRNILTADPGMGEAHNNIGTIHEMRGDYEKALEEYLKAVKVKPYLAAPHANIGGLYARQRRYPEALREFDAAIVNDPRYAPAYLGRGKAEAAAGKKAEAVADFRRAVALDPSDKEAAEQLRLAGG